MSAVVRHTPSPWIAAPFSSIVGAPVVSQQGRTVAKVAYPLTPGMPQAAIDESVANGHLIAAAPELLEALRDLAEYVEDIADEDVFPTEYGLLQAALKAIAKAEGRSA